MRLQVLVALATPYLLVQVQSSGNVPKQQHTREKGICRLLALYATVGGIKTVTFPSGTA